MYYLIEICIATSIWSVFIDFSLPIKNEDCAWIILCYSQFRLIWGFWLRVVLDLSDLIWSISCLNKRQMRCHGITHRTIFQSDLDDCGINLVFYIYVLGNCRRQLFHWFEGKFKEMGWTSKIWTHSPWYVIMYHSGCRPTFKGCCLLLDIILIFGVIAYKQMVFE